MSLYCTISEISSLILQNLRRSDDSKHMPFGSNISCMHSYSSASISTWNLKCPAFYQVQKYEDLEWPLTTPPNHPIFDILYRLSYLCAWWVEIEISNLVRRLIVASASPWMANHPWKGRGQVRWTIQILVGTNHISGTADRVRRCQLSLPVSVINFWWSSDNCWSHHRRDLYSAARPSRKKWLDYHNMMRYGIFNMRWASASRGSVSGSGDPCLF